MNQKHLRNLFLFFVLLITNSIFSQNYLLKNEILIYSFETTNGKKLVLAKDMTNKYIIYRFGTKNKIEFEFPEKNKDSWKKFKYSFYFRGGGIQNEGMDLNYITFSNQEYDYIIYDTYYSINKISSVGIKISNKITKKTIDIGGEINSRKGSLIDFRTNELIEINMELDFD